MKTVERRSSHQRDSYRIVRVSFRPTYRWWWDEPTVIGLALTVTLLAIGILVVLTTRR